MTDQVPAAHQLLLSIEEDPRLEEVCRRHPFLRTTLSDARLELIELMRLDQAGSLGPLQVAAAALRIKQVLRGLRRQYLPVPGLGTVGVPGPATPARSR